MASLVLSQHYRPAVFFILACEDSKANRLKQVFYDQHHKAELARPNLDLYLQSIYVEHSDPWSSCCVQTTRGRNGVVSSGAVRDLIQWRQEQRVMLRRADEVTQKCFQPRRFTSTCVSIRQRS